MKHTAKEKENKIKRGLVNAQSLSNEGVRTPFEIEAHFWGIMSKIKIILKRNVPEPALGGCPPLLSPKAKKLQKVLKSIYQGGSQQKTKRGSLLFQGFHDRN